MLQPPCGACGYALGRAAVWLTHNGRPWCYRCVPDDIWEELQEIDGRWWYQQPLCEGGCGRVVLDRRNRRSTIRVCSEQCRQVVRNDLRRMERRSKQPVLPPTRCDECGGELHVTRSDIRYCSVRCRVRAYRRRTR